MLAHVNNSGQHISIWLVGPDTGIGWGSSPHYPYQEGAYFGNIFASPWQGYYCAGKDMASGEVPGRLGTPVRRPTCYMKPVRRQMAASNAAVPRAPSTNERLHELHRSRARRRPTPPGHKWTHVGDRVAELRGDADVQDLQRATAASAWAWSAAAPPRAPASSSAPTRAPLSQNWQILTVSPGNYKIVNVASGKALDVSGTQVVQRPYTAADQQVPIAYIDDEPGYANLKWRRRTRRLLEQLVDDQG